MFFFLASSAIRIRPNPCDPHMHNMLLSNEDWMHNMLLTDIDGCITPRFLVASSGHEKRLWVPLPIN